MNQPLPSDSRPQPLQAAAPRVYLVGAGPGDPGLITVRGLAVLQQADVVIYDALIPTQLLRQVRKEAELIYVGKQAGRHTLPQQQINQLLVEHARAGKSVVRLKGGDPFVFGRGGEEAIALAKENVPFEIVPGVTAGVAAAAYAGIPITHREFASDVAFITGHEAEDRGESSAVDWPSLGRWKGTLVFYMGVKHLADICENLIRHGMPSDTPAALVEWGTTARQRTLVASLATLAEEAVRSNFHPPALTIIGKVVTLRDTLSWFEARPLFGRRIVVTRPKAQAPEMVESLRRLGAEVIEFPVIRIEPAQDIGPLQQAITRLDAYTWIVFTSVNGVDAFFEQLHACRKDARAMALTKICAIGPATAARLTSYGITPDLIPPDYVAESIVTALAEKYDLDQQRFLLPRADVAREDLAIQLQQLGARVDEVVAYRTVAEESPPDEISDALKKDTVDWITFTSSSSVRHFVEKVGGKPIRTSRARLASIGPVTSSTLRESGLTVDLEAKHYTVQGIIDALCRTQT